MDRRSDLRSLISTGPQINALGSQRKGPRPPGTESPSESEPNATDYQEAATSAQSIDGSARPYYQFLAGHALIGSYLCDKIRKIESRSRWWCDGDERQSRFRLIARCRA